MRGEEQREQVGEGNRLQQVKFGGGVTALTLRLRVRRHRRRSREQVEVKKKESKWRRTGEYGPMLHGSSRSWHLSNILFSTASSLRELMAASGFWPRMRGSNWRDLAGEHFPPIRGRRWREDGFSWPCLTLHLLLMRPCAVEFLRRDMFYCCGGIVGAVALCGGGVVGWHPSKGPWCCAMLGLL